MNEIVVPLVKTDDNLSDFFTKVLAPKRFIALRNKIMNVADAASADSADAVG